MKNKTQKMAAVLLIFALLSPFVTADSTTATMTWNVPSSISFTVAYGGTCSSTSIFFNEQNGIIDQGDVDSNGYGIKPQPSRTITDANCQSASAAAMTVTSTGNVNMDINFQASAAMTAGAVLKVWMGDGTGCGLNGLVGYEDTCSVTSATDPVTASTCKEFNNATGTVSHRIVSALIPSDSNMLCFAGDINRSQGILPQADTNALFNVQSKAS